MTSNNQADVDLSGKTIIVTGANAGIGKFAARELARMGASVTMVARSRERGEKALQEVQRASDSNDVSLMLCDLSSQASIREFAADFEAVPTVDLSYDDAVQARMWEVSEAALIQ